MTKNAEHSAEKMTSEALAILKKSVKRSQQQQDQEGKDQKSQAAEKCECPPGCVGLPCCS